MSKLLPDGAAARTTQIPGLAETALPKQPPVVKDVKTSRRLLFTLRHFHLGDPGAMEALEPLGTDLLPALLSPFRDTSHLRYDYPLFLFPAETQDGHAKAGQLACPLIEWLQGAMDKAAGGGETARILKDHLPWLDHHLRQTLTGSEGPLEAAGTLAQAGEALKTHLALEETTAERLEADLRVLAGQVPPGAMIMGYGRYPAMHLLVHAIRSRLLPRRARFATLVGNCIHGLEGLLEVEWTKSDESIEPAHARESVGPGNTLFDLAALSEVMDHSRGTQRMPEERRARIEQALRILSGWQDDPVLVRFVHDGRLTCEWLHGGDSITELEAEDPCAQATRLFDEQAARLAEVFGAVRIAQLEINGIYDPAIHDPWFDKFTWEAFSQEELQLVPAVIAVGDAEWLAGDGMRSFSRLLSSGRPVQILVRVQPSLNPSAVPGENPFHHYRLELGYLGISHRQAVVIQSSAARHPHLIAGYLTALDATRTSLHILNTGTRSDTRLVPLNAWLVAGAALEGRAHPFFHVNPEAGDAAAARVNFADNPQPERDWPLHPFAYVDENGNRVDQELAFTFADYSLLVDALRDHFRLIPPGTESDALVPMQDYLAMKPDEAYQRVPFTWGVDGSGQLHRLVVTRELALACLDRLNYWHTLQELAGVRSRYVDQAIERTRREERESARLEREKREAEHTAELDRVRRESAGEAMQRLTELLLGTDFSRPLSAAPAAPATVAKAAPAPASAPAAPVSEPAEGEGGEEDEELSFDDPWIDTPLCTSCNDCLKINPLLFVYNDEKQAALADLQESNATYAQLVQAAELCPARCIHPGKPWNLDEPGLDDLIERAAPFNQ